MIYQINKSQEKKSLKKFYKKSWKINRKSKEPLKQYNNEEADIRMMYDVAQEESNAVIPAEDTNVLILYPKSQNLKHMSQYMKIIRQSNFYL